MNRSIKNLHQLAFLTTFCFAFLLNVSAEQSAVEGKNVKAVHFSGVEQTQWDRVQTKAQTREGHPFSSQIANEDIRRLIAAGYFCREYTVNLVGDEVEVTFSISPEPNIDQIEFAGSLKKKHIKKFKDLIQARVGDLLRQHQINADKQAMLIELKSKGYHFVEIDQEILPGPAGGATVRFIVNPQKAVRVKDIEFIGATAFSKRKLRKILKTKIDKWYNSAKYIQETFEEDLKRLREFYRMKGWLDATTTVDVVEFTKEKKKVVLKVNVNEGGRYGVDSLSFEGNTLFTTEQLQALTELKAAGDYSREQMQLDLKALRDLYGERGYVRSEIKVDEIVLPEEKKVRLKYSIVENEKSYVETINVFGNTRTKDIVIRREIDLIPGEEFNTVKMDGSIRRLRNLGFFEKVEAEYVPGSEENLSSVNIRVKEGKTGVFRIGAGFSSNNSLIGSVAITQRNFDYKDVPKSWHDFLVGSAFVGDGQNLTVQAQPGALLNRYVISWTEPYLFDRPILLGLTGSHFNRDRSVYEETRTSGSVRLGKRLLPDLQLEGIYRYEIVDLSNLNLLTAPLAVIDAQGTTNVSSITGELTYDKRDDFFFPSQGHRSELSYEFAGSFIGGDLDFHKVIASHSMYFTLFETRDENAHVLSLRLRSGWMDDIGGTKIPIFERFFLGGSNSVRGFEFRTVGPQENNEPLGGEFFYQVNTEYRFPLFGDIFQGVLFNDIGNVTPFLGNGQEFSTWRAAVGFGIRIKVPALGPVPITLDFGFPWRKQDGDDKELLSFQFGTAF